MAPYLQGAMSWRHYWQITKPMATGQRLVALNNRLLQNQQPASNVFNQNIFSVHLVNVSCLLEQVKLFLKTISIN